MSSTTTATVSNPEVFAAFGGDSKPDPFTSKTSSSDPFGGDPFAGFAAPASSNAKEGGASDPFASFADFGSAKFEVGDSAWPPQDGAKQDESKSTPQDQDKSQSDGVTVKTEAGSSDA